MAAIAEDSKTFGALPEEDALAYSHVQALAEIQLEIQQLRSALPSLIYPLTHNTADGSTTTTTATTSSSATNPGSTTTTTTLPNSVVTPATNGLKSTDSDPSSKTNPSNGTVSAPTAAATAPLPASEVSAEFRDRSIKVQSKVQSLVKNLESLCDTLEAAEKVRNEDYNELGELAPAQQGQDASLQRTNVLRELPGLELTGVLTGTSTRAVEEESLAPAIEAGNYLFDGQAGGLDTSFDRGDSGMFDDFGLSNYNDDWDTYNTNTGVPMQ